MSAPVTIARKPRAPGRPSSGFPLGVRALKFDEWPEADQRAWQTTLRRAGPLTPSGRAAHLADGTVTKRRNAWGFLLSFLASINELDPNEAVHERLTPDRLGRYITHLMIRLRASSVHYQSVELSYALGAMVPDRDWGWVRRHPARPTAAEIRASRKPVAPPDPRDLFRGAMEICNEADRAVGNAVEAALQYRDGLLLALACCFALRCVAKTSPRLRSADICS